MCRPPSRHMLCSPSPSGDIMPSFIDRVVIHAVGGNGGHGCTSIHREK